jgi:hypothetical protein
LLALLPNLAAKKVTSLEPRTPHQPEKLEKLSKNDCFFTPFISAVNEKAQLVSTRVFNQVQPIHSPATGIGAALQANLNPTPRQARLFTEFSRLARFPEFLRTPACAVNILPCMRRAMDLNESP